MRASVLVLGMPELQQPLWHLADILRTGQSGLISANGGSPYTHFARHPDHGRLFHDHMISRSRQVAPRIAQEFCGEGTLVDLGGGYGTILAEILLQHPGWNGILVERPEVLPHAERYLTELGVIDRCELVDGDFFATVPPAAEAYLLGSIIHNYDDGEATAILANVGRAMNATSRLLCVDMLLPEDDRPHPGLPLDIRMMTRTPGGRERTLADYHILLERGLGITASPRIIRLPLGLNMLITSLSDQQGNALDQVPT
jgi:hypothetical protein